MGTYQFSSGVLTVSLSDDVSNGYVVADAIRIVEVPPVTEAPAAVDNADAAYGEIGSGWQGWSETGAYQGDFRYHAAGTSQNAATWTIDCLDPTKQYEVYATWSAQSNRATDAPYTILNGEISLGTVRVNQQLAPADATYDSQSWKILGTYQFSSGSLTVTLSDDASSGYVIADAVHVVEVPQVPDMSEIVDNSETAYSETGTGWSDRQDVGDYLGDSRRHAAGTGQSTASWQFTDLPAGYYMIYATWAAAGDQATNAPFTIYEDTSAVGTERVNQQLVPASVTADGTVWQLVGSYWIDSGEMRVELSDDANGAVVADAIRIVDPPMPLYWDTNGEDPGFGDGNGTWDTTTPMWNPRADGTGTLTVWPSTRGTAYFAGTTGGTITIASSIDVQTISFMTSGYTIKDGSLTCSYSSGMNIYVGTGVTATITSPIGGSYGFTKLNSGTLNLSGQNTYSGSTTLAAGQINVNSTTALGTSTLTISGTSTIGNSSGGAITLTNNNLQNWNANFTFAGPQDLNLGTGAVTLGGNRQVTVSAGQLTAGGVISGNYSLTKAGSGTLTLTGENTYSGGQQSATEF